MYPKICQSHFIVFFHLSQYFANFCLIFYFIFPKRDKSKFFQGTPSSGGGATKRILSFKTGCVKLKEYAQSASLPFCAVGPP